MWREAFLQRIGGGGFAGITLGRWQGERTTKLFIAKALRRRDGDLSALCRRNP